MFAAADLRRAATELDLGNQVQRALAAIASRDELVEVVTHDLRSPLSVVALQAMVMTRTLVADGSAASRRLFAAASSITKASGRMSEMLADLLDLGFIEQGRFQVHPEPHVVQDLFDDARALLTPIAEARHIELTFECALPWLVSVDAERIYQVFANLVGNAVKFTAEHGSVRVEATACPADDTKVQFTVSDIGRGMSTETLSHIFERYWLVRDANPSGTGLGLYITKGLVKAHGGSINAKSQLFIGSCFMVHSPKVLKANGVVNRAAKRT